MAFDQGAFPQDISTGLQETVDWNDAAAFAWLAHHPNTTAHVLEGFEVTPDWGNDIINISEGVAVLEQDSANTNDHSGDGGPDELTLQGAEFKVQRGVSGDIPINAGTNYCYLGLNHAENDDVFWQVNTSEDPPDPPYLLVAEVDTATQEVTYPNEYPTQTSGRMLITPG